MSGKWKQKKQCATLLSREEGFIKKAWGTGHSVCLAYPNVYRIGMANLGFQTVYTIFNKLPLFLCERVFLPADSDAESVDCDFRLVSLENKMPLRDFDILAFSVSFENDYPAILKILEFGGIPLKSKDRDGTYPLILGGGIAPSLNPEPLADFFDLFLLGEAEDTLPRFAAVFSDARGRKLERKSLLFQLQKQAPAVYVPSVYQPQYFSNGKIQSILPLEEGLPEKIKTIPANNSKSLFATEAISNSGAGLSDMFLIEINRGCPHFCRFCAAAFVYAPPRFRSYEEVIAAAEFGLTRKKKIGLVGTAVSDHPQLEQICQYLVERQAEIGVASLRLDRITPSLADLLKAGGIETVALAPEAGSQRLRDLLQKGICAEDIFSCVKILIEKGICNLRLYFMVGLPTETNEDIDAIVELTKKIQLTALEATKGKRKFRRITLSINQFIPKPHTPLQWFSLANVRAVQAKIKKIERAFRQDKQISVIADAPKWNYVQALLCLGDRRVGEILLAVHRRQGNWAQALKESNINPDFYVYRPKDLEEFLPWDLIAPGHGCPVRVD